MKLLKTYLFLILLFGYSAISFAQTSDNPTNPNVVVDEVVGIVGSEVVLLSDIEATYLQYRSSMPSITKCEVFDDLLFQKLLITQAAIDSVVVSDAQVDMELDNRVRYFVSQFGSKEKLEQFYGKTISEIRDEFRETIHDQLLVETVKSNITSNIKITPSEVKQYYKSLSIDEIPEISTQYDLGQIVKEPKVGTVELEEAFNKIKDIKDRIMKGEDFSTMAVLYSEDPGSASAGGAIGTVGRGETFTEFEAAAFSLKKGEISEIVKTQAGYHIIKMIERKGEFINVQHILIRPKVSPYELRKAKEYLDSIYTVIKNDTTSFEVAAKKYSDDPSKNNGGIIINPYTGTSNFDAQQLGSYDPQLFFVVDKMNVGDISHPSQFQTKDGNDAYRIVYLKSRSTPHKANLKDDYSKIQTMAENQKHTLAIAKWVQNKAALTYVFIKEQYHNCDILDKWITK